MGYTKRNGEFADTDALTLFGSGSKPATVSGAAVETGDRAVARLNLTVASGTGTLDVAVETSADGATWRSLGAFPQSTGTPSNERRSFSGLDRFVRATATIGTGPFDFSVTGEAVLRW